MARDPRKNSAYDSGLRGREKPKVQGGNTDNNRAPRGETSGGEVQGPGKRIGDSEGVGLDAYSSGMRGPEKRSQKSPEQATQGVEAAGGGESAQGPSKKVGNPKGDDTAGTGKRDGLNDGAARSHTSDAYKLGIAGNNTENAALGEEPSFDEDDTHINIRVPKASFKRKQSGLNKE
jgi:hypothetical protein